MKGKFENLEGRVFNRLTVIKMGSKNKYNGMTWICKCICGKTVIAATSSLTSGNTSSCGCYNIYKIKERLIKHGKWGTTEYRSWAAMKDRCYNKKSERYKDWGGRGVTVCQRWLDSFDNFLEDMGTKPSPKYSLDRFPDNDGDYEPNNCRWATYNQQNGNRRTNRWLEYNGKRMILQDWAKELNVSESGIRQHLKNGKTFSWIYRHLKNTPHLIGKPVLVKSIKDGIIISHLSIKDAAAYFKVSKNVVRDSFEKKRAVLRGKCKGVKFIL